METGILQKVNHYLNNGFYASVSTDDECDTAKKVLPEHASQTSEKVFLLLAGGTGGHIFPGLAVAEALQQRGFTIHWLGTKEGMEATLVPEHGFPVSFLSVKGVRGKGLKALLMAPWRILKSTVQAISVLRKLKPLAVLGMGGFVAGPGSLAAYLLRIPLIIHEQNAVPGMTNRLAAPMAKKILTGFPHILSGYKKTYYTGNPVRQMIQSGPPPYLHSDHGRLRILVLGGSRGALIINQTMPRALALLDNPPEVIHQCGSDHETVTKKLYQDSGVMVKVIPFVNDMAKAYEWADIVICRSGALTVSE
ncbi:MAG: undecaprenyldiphospho-muramoylpentapeptide beta-N-acetylglucosaminyltransferase, partial [Endozoicomonadaceae bacterium]|nr:undecaprenyldiphospho-muramoylpentapeptide beta-N-acetylglucosaminyltransferase [Endozoicomonadaceae bacterium]